VLAPGGTENDGAALSALATHEHVSFLHATAARWEGLIETGMKAARGLVALCGGGVSDELAEHILDRCRVLFSAYGSPETTLYATLGRVEPSMAATVGRPIANVCAHVVDGQGELVPVGVVGALVIGGEGVSEYLDRDDLNARAFVADPCGQMTAFVTGDRARWRSSGRLELLSREHSLASAAAPGR
jgi:non-ribosomal peptide synthetase component F